MKRRSPRSPHVGGTQLPLIVPESDWVSPQGLPDLRHHGAVVAIDVENNDEGLNAGQGSGWPKQAGHICGLAIAWDGGALYAPTRHPDTDNLDPQQVAAWIKDHAAAGVRFVTHHGQHDWGWIGTEWSIYPPAGGIDDTEAMAAIVDENRLTYSLGDLCRWRGVPGKDEGGLREAAAAYGYADNVKGNLWRMPARYVGPYAAQDAAATLALYGDLLPDVQPMWDAYETEMDLLPMVLAMRRRGVRINVDGAVEARAGLLRQRDEVLADLSSRLGRRVGLDDCRSPRILEGLFQAHKVAFPRTEKTGQGSFQAKWMRKHEHFLPRLVARVEQLEEAANKFLKGYILDYAHRGRVHASINQYRGEEGGTRSHRFSYSDPALQQMPSRDDDLAPLIRGVFLPEEGEAWLAADYSQQEYRLIVHYAYLLGCRGAEAAAVRYREDPATDFHVYVSEITGLERRPAKDTNFAKAFGAGVAKFAEMIGKTREEAEAIYKQYDQELPFVSETAKRCQKAADHRGHIRLIDGARSHFDMWEVAWREQGEAYISPRPLAAAKEAWPNKRIRRAFTHKAMSRLIQGSAARQTKMAMRACWREGLVPLLQMHDELDFSIGSQERAARVLELMRDAVKLEVPVMVDGELGPSWGKAKTPLADYFDGLPK